jgi:hypothetical protein
VLDSRPLPAQERGFDDRREQRALAHELLDLVQQRLPLLEIDLGGLLAEQPVDVGIAAVGADAAGDDEGVDPGGALPGAALPGRTSFLKLFSASPL